MKNRAVAWGALAALLALVFGGAVGQAKTNTILNAGAWEAFGGTTSKNQPICGMSTEVATHYLGVKRITGKAGFGIQMGTGQWKLSNGLKHQVIMNFDSNPAWSLTGTAFHFDDGDAGLEIILSDDRIDAFLREFRGSSRLNVKFPDANFADWQLSLGGSSAVTDAFLNCLRTLPR